MGAPSSSANSRSRQATGFSPRSSRPPGNSHASRSFRRSTTRSSSRRTPFTEPGKRIPLSPAERILLVFFTLDLLPQGFERVEIAARRALGGERLDAPEAALEFCSGTPQCRFGVDIELSGKVGRGKKNVTHLLLQGAAPAVLLARGLVVTRI